MTQTRTKMICTGAYKTVNTTPIAHITKNCDTDGWTVSYDGPVGYAGTWRTKAECLDLINSISENYADNHDHPISIIK